LATTLHRVLREPLLHFAIVGGVLLVVDAWRSPAETTPAIAGTTAAPAGPRSPIVVDARVRAALVARWSQTHSAAPDEAQMQRLVARWIDEEVLYREGLARGLAEDDPEVRQRVVSQMGYVLRASAEVPAPSEDELRRWFLDHADTYAEPDRVDFTQVFVAGHDATAQARAQELLGLLQGGADPNGLGDTYAGGRRFRGRRLADLTERFGPQFTAGLDAQPLDTWALRPSDDGLHLVRVDRRSSAIAPDFEAVRAAVEHDVREAAGSEGLEAALARLRANWEIVE
jgi:hypothetical protein